MKRPEENEYSKYYNQYVNTVKGNNVIAVLEDLSESTFTFLSKIPEEKGNYRYSDGKWSVKEVVGHLIDTERVMTYRALRFARNDKQELSGFDQDDYVKNTDFGKRTLKNLAYELRSLKKADLFLYKSFNDEELTRSGIANGVSVTVNALLYIIAGHELHHLNIIKERYLSG